MINLEYLDKFPLEIYEKTLKGPLTKLYCAKEKSKRNDWTKYSDLLIDKFAIHSIALFHLMYGLTEMKDSTPEYRKSSFDMFSVNSLLRVLMETYLTFNHIFVSPKTNDEKEFRFLIWKLDGLLEKKKFRIDNLDFTDAKSVLQKDAELIGSLFQQIEDHSFYKLLPTNEVVKIVDKSKQRTCWKFSVSTDFKIKQLKIIELVETICCVRAFVNTYKYSSIFSHSGFVCIDHFERFRGKLIPDDYFIPIVKQAIFLTFFMIKDIAIIDVIANIEFLKLPIKIREDINGINRAFRNISE